MKFLSFLQDIFSLFLSLLGFMKNLIFAIKEVRRNIRNIVKKVLVDLPKEYGIESLVVAFMAIAMLAASYIFSFPITVVSFLLPILGALIVVYMIQNFCKEFKSFFRKNSFEFRINFY